uniref:Uncharacterized protein n=1 Tax=Octopus bimaculoides TaxID=37653 RepID=A0A0L8HXJ1_OCTBM
MGPMSTQCKRPKSHIGPTSGNMTAQCCTVLQNEIGLKSNQHNFQCMANISNNISLISARYGFAGWDCLGKLRNLFIADCLGKLRSLVHIRTKQTPKRRKQNK